MIRINQTLVEDVLELENIFRSAGMEEHARAIRIALENAEEDIIQEKKYGTDNIIDGINSAANLYRSIKANITRKSTNDDLIGLLNDHIDDINNIRNIEDAPKFVKSNNTPIIKSLSSLITHLKNQNPEDKINKNTIHLIRNLKHAICGDQ